MTKGEALIEMVEKFVEDNRIYCAEVVCDSDRVIEHAYQFIIDLCNVVGYLQYEDDDMDE